MWGNTLLKIYISIDKPCNFIKKTPTRAYFRHLLCTEYPVSIFAWIFTLQKLRIGMLFRWGRGGICSFSFISHTCLAFLKYTLPRQAFSGELCKVFSNTKNFQKNYLLHTFFQLKVPIFTNNFTQVTFS